MSVEEQLLPFHSNESGGPCGIKLTGRWKRPCDCGLSEAVDKLIKQARIELLEEILELPDTNGGCPNSHVKAKFTSWFEERLQELKNAD